MSQLQFGALAMRDLQEIHDYIADNNTTAATKFIERLESRCRLLAEQPNIGRRRDEIALGMRSSTEGNYRILYQAITNGVMIVRIVHTKRDPANIEI